MADNPSLLDMDDDSEDMGSKEGEEDDGHQEFVQEDGSSKMAVLVGAWRHSRVLRTSREGNIKMPIHSMCLINQKRWRQKRCGGKCRRQKRQWARNAVMKWKKCSMGWGVMHMMAS
jgi:hypothetical protein